MSQLSSPANQSTLVAIPRLTRVYCSNSAIGLPIHDFRFLSDMLLVQVQLPVCRSSGPSSTHESCTGISWQIIDNHLTHGKATPFYNAANEQKGLAKQQTMLGKGHPLVHSSRFKTNWMSSCQR